MARGNDFQDDIFKANVFYYYYLHFLPKKCSFCENYLWETASKNLVALNCQKKILLESDEEERKMSPRFIDSEINCRELNIAEVPKDYY